MNILAQLVIFVNDLTAYNSYNFDFYLVLYPYFNDTREVAA